MRKLVAVLIVLFGCFAFIGQAVASASAGYSDCCLHGCKGMTQCASVSCQTCAAPQAVPAPELPLAPIGAGMTWCLAAIPFDAGLRREPWTPPD